VRETNSRGFLPVISDSALLTTSATGKAAIARYLDAISIPQNSKLRPVGAGEILEAFQTLTTDRNPEPLNTIANDIENNVDVLTRVEVPAEAVELHKKYLAGSLSLLENTERLRHYQQDTVGALVAASRIESLRQVFDEVAKSIQELEKKYTIT
jgi:hypothetical protein